MVSETYLPPARLLLSSRWAALAVVVDGAPAAAMTSYALAPDGASLYLHLSQMALHTRALLTEPRAALAVSAPDTGDGDPQTLPRLSLSGVALALVPGTPEYETGQAAYVSRFPAAGERFALADFVLFRFEPSEARWVGGFARALRMSGTQLAEALAEAGRG
ncbi:MAG TPA: pyridoxamine 5'-phosphate oxidase family protein [Thermoanaerobaculia bacterium]|jgi:putative heme iron utilization protein|nr:pyridoxamine 5'-phosphate oxidase family protein [Thermoanaerobaculia bacterium]HPA51835.1 pyridoxamine 5'-phosphate oxidase family protein [Thermoanaerobaculia bacterium]